MRQRSEAFDAAIRGSHTVVVEAELFCRGESVNTVRVLGGDWTDDRTATIRRNCRLALPASADLIPAAEWADDNGLWPVGNELQLRSGVRYSDGTTELLDLGRYRISKPTLSDDGRELNLSVEGFDRSRTVSRARFTVPYSIANGQDYATEIKRLLMSRMPTLHEEDFQFMATNGSDGGPVFKTPALLFTNQDDPWLKAVEMAQSFGAELFFDGVGSPVLRLERDVVSTPTDWEYEEGEGSNLLKLDRVLDDEGSYNGVIVTGSSTDLPVPLHAEFWDTSPSSPTYYDPAVPEASSYGAVPYFMDSQYILTQEQADLAARNNFFRVCGITEAVSFGAIAHPAHESGDVVLVRRDRANVNNVYAMDSIRGGLGYTGTMSVTTKARRVF